MNAESVSPQQVFDELRLRIESRPELKQEVDGIFQFDITGEAGGSWTIDLKNDAGGVSSGVSEAAECVITVADQDFRDIMQRQLDPMTAFMTGRIRVAGDVGLATKLQALFR